MSEVRVRPISGGHIVSHYQRDITKPNQPGQTVETFHPTHKAAADYMAELWGGS